MYHLVSGLYAQYTQTPRYNVLLLGISGSGKTAWLDKVRSKVTKTGSRSLNRVQPTVGQNVFDLKLARATLHFWDLGGESSLRRLWSRYFEEADVLVWAMDSRDWVTLVSNDEERGEEEDDEEEDEQQQQRSLCEARRQESWDALVSLRSRSHLISLPLLILVTHLDQLKSSHRDRFEAEIKTVLQTKLAEVSKTEETDLEVEMNQLDQSTEGKAYQKLIWSEWEVITCSAKDGTGVDEFVNWLHSHARKAQVG